MTSREAFEAALTKARNSSTQTDPLYWNTSDAMFWAWQAAIQHARDVAVKVCEEQAKKPECPERAIYCADAIKEALK